MPNREFKITKDSHVDKRLDFYLSQVIQDLSRSQIQNLIHQENVLVNSEVITKPSTRLKPGDHIEIQYHIPDSPKIVPQEMPLDIVYQDEDLAVVNKPSGLIVHPGAGTQKPTLVHALIHHFPEMKEVGPQTRPGIVHRLDKETSGLLVVAKNSEALQALKHQFKQRQVEKIYLGLVWGRYVKNKGVISWPVGRHVTQGARISIRTKKPKKAETRFEVLNVFQEHSLLRIQPVTGRTHQIRVHMSASGHPIVGDKRYGRKKKKNRIQSRMFLHAASLSFFHPRTQKRMSFEIPLPDDLKQVLKKF
ncbi:MAG: RluA family pseudouridine synthase [Candidatus Aminicenantes bacterium]|nr:RluA family pseudouridine synthase [Candidatus Aminicenantes bacterium]